MRTLTALLTASLLLGLAATPASAQKPRGGNDKGFELGQRLGVDDGYALVIEASGDLAGNLEPCG